MYQMYTYSTLIRKVFIEFLIFTWILSVITKSAALEASPSRVLSQHTLQHIYVVSGWQLPLLLNFDI
jgi:hypothetical protein